ncbi:hypothetical protein vseg_013263 [Gypsophila vaccaria]
MTQVEQLPTAAAAAGDKLELDYAPESFWVSQDAELDWLDRNAVIDRKDSGKAAQPHHPSSTGSNRFSGSLKSKPSIIGLPKPTKPNYRRPCKGSSIRLFPKRSDSVGNKSEPSSPKVSCMGRVRSRRGKSRRKAGVGENNKNIQDRKPGFWNNFRAMFQPKPLKTEEDWDSGVPPSNNSNKKNKSKKTNKNKKREFDSNDCSSAGAEAPGLGAVKRFASARRSDAWAADLQGDSGPHHVDVELQRDCHSVGSASV